MSEEVDCLFSLEVVVDKLYIPHVVCRFPALAFRLLDFPTILIPHVESERAQRLKESLSDDSNYQPPPQFPELKDKHGNFMVKKGKSCLFKTSLQALRKHLLSTPLYVMVVDTFAEIPKLLGNSTVPLDKIIENIYVDVLKVGNSIPSVHGDRGLFKIYNLMGKEIGYVILGYRLLSVGPSLVPHLAENVLVDQGNKPEELPELDTCPAEDETNNQNIYQQNEATLTDPVGQTDAMLQTDELQVANKSTSSEIQQYEDQPNKTVHTISTQTARLKSGKKSKRRSDCLTVQTLVDEKPDYEDVNFSNVHCPPPLFYIGKKETQTVWLSRRLRSPDISNSNFEDYSDIVSEASYSKSVTSVRKGNVNTRKTEESLPSGSSYPQQNHHQILQQNVSQNLNVFPILSALIQELSSLQVPQQIVGENSQQTLMNLVRSKASKIPPTPTGLEKENTQIPKNNASQLTPELSEQRHDQQSSPHHTCKSGRLSHRSCASDHSGVPKNKSWLRSTPEHAIKKSKLTFGMTNTQRLRLAKASPEKFKMKDSDKGKQPPVHQLAPPKEEFDDGNLSDMSTEIRRHTLDEIDDEDINRQPSENEVKKEEHPAIKRTEPDKTRVSFNDSVEKLTFTPSRAKPRLKPKKPSPKFSRKQRKAASPPPSLKKGNNSTAKKKDLNVNITASNSNEDNNQVTDTGTEDTPREPPPTTQEPDQVLVVPDLPQYVPYELDSTDSDEVVEPISHRSQKSIEVRLPSAEPQSGEESVLNSSDRPENGASKMGKQSTFVGFPDKSDNYWDSLEIGNRADGSDVEDLENSYVPSWGMDSNIDKRYRSSGVFSSTGDLDSHQFQSTEEQELLDLISDGESKSHSSNAGISENVSEKTKSSEKGSASTVLRIPVLNPVASEASPVPSTRRSIARAELSTAVDNTEKSPASSARPTPRPRSRKGRELEKKESVNTESVSTYAPSDMDNMNTSIASDDPTYSEDFNPVASDEDISNLSPIPSVPRFIPTTKLGYTIS